MCVEDHVAPGSNNAETGPTAYKRRPGGVSHKDLYEVEGVAGKIPKALHALTRSWEKVAQSKTEETGYIVTYHNKSNGYNYIECIHLKSDQYCQSILRRYSRHF